MIQGIFLIVIAVVFCGPAEAGTQLSYAKGLALARSQSAAGKYDLAEETLSRLASRFPRNPEIIVFQARIRSWKKDYAGAVSLFRRSLAIRMIPEVRMELERAEALLEMEKAERLERSGEAAESIRLLSGLFSRGIETYESGRRLSSLYLKLGEMELAREVLIALRKLFPNDADIALSIVRTWAEQKAEFQASAVLDALPREWRERADAQQLKGQITVSIEQRAADFREVLAEGRLAHADDLLARGDGDAAADILGRLYAEDHRYDAGLRLGRIYMGRRDYGSALSVYGELSSRYPGNSELPILLSRAETALLLSEAANLKAAAGPEKAEKAYRAIYESGRETYESGYNLGMILIGLRRYEEARSLFDTLASRYPEDRGFKQLAIETRILNGDTDGARKLVNELPPAELTLLGSERPDILYRIRRNNLRLSGGLASFSNGQPLEKSLSAAATQKIGGYTAVLQGSRIERFGKQDTQAALDLYTGLGEKRGNNAQVSLSVSPDASFLPRYTAGAEISKGLGNWDVSAGAYEFAFRGSNAFIVVPGLTRYFPRGWSVNERLYLVLSNGTFSSLTTVYWEPDHRLRTAAGLSIGKAGERIGTSQDILRSSSLGIRVSGEYRILPEISAGIELFSEHRRNLYDRNGGTVFTRYWW